MKADSIALNEHLNKLKARIPRLESVIPQHQEAVETACTSTISWNWIALVALQSEIDIEIEKLKSIIDTQEISAEEFERMNAEQLSLTNSIADANSDADKASKEVWELEKLIENIVDQVCCFPTSGFTIFRWKPM